MIWENSTEPFILPYVKEIIMSSSIVQNGQDSCYQCTENPEGWWGGGRQVQDGRHEAPMSRPMSMYGKPPIL